MLMRAAVMLPAKVAVPPTVKFWTVIIFARRHCRPPTNYCQPARFQMRARNTNTGWTSVPPILNSARNLSRLSRTKTAAIEYRVQRNGKCLLSVTYAWIGIFSFLNLRRMFCPLMLTSVDFLLALKLAEGRCSGNQQNKQENKEINIHATNNAEYFCANDF